MTPKATRKTSPSMLHNGSNVPRHNKFRFCLPPSLRTESAPVQLFSSPVLRISQLQIGETELKAKITTTFKAQQTYA